MSARKKTPKIQRGPVAPISSQTAVSLGYEGASVGVGFLTDAMDASSIPGLSFLSHTITSTIDKFDGRKRIKEFTLKNAIRTYVNCQRLLLFIRENGRRYSCLSERAEKDFVEMLGALVLLIVKLSNLSIFRDTAERVTQEVLQSYWKPTVVTGVRVPKRSSRLVRDREFETIFRFIKTAGIKKDELHMQLRKLYPSVKSDDESMIRSATEIIRVITDLVNSYVGSLRGNNDRNEILRLIGSEITQYLLNIIIQEEFLTVVILTQKYEHEFESLNDLDMTISTRTKAILNFYKNDFKDLIQEINEKVTYLNHYYQTILFEIMDTPPCTTTHIRPEPMFNMKTDGGTMAPIFQATKTKLVPLLQQSRQPRQQQLALQAEQLQPLLPRYRIRSQVEPSNIISPRLRSQSRR